MSGETVSFERNIRPLFRQRDINCMRAFGGFDLASYDDVRTHHAQIFERLSSGTMPPDQRWPQEQIATFQSWIAEGMNP